MAGKTYLEGHNQVAGIVYSIICANNGVPGSQWETPLKVIDKDQAKILWDFRIQTDKFVVNQVDIAAV